MGLELLTIKVYQQTFNKYAYFCRKLHETEKKECIPVGYRLHVTLRGEGLPDRDIPDRDPPGHRPS